MKRVIVLFLILLFLNTNPTQAASPTETIQCVVEAQPNYSTSSECRYLPYSGGPNTDFYSSCYQNYLVRKKDWETRCFRYWDEQKAKAQTSNPTATPAPANTSNSDTAELEKRLKETENKLNIALTQGAAPKYSNSYTVPGQPRIGFENPNDVWPTVYPTEHIQISPAQFDFLPTVIPTLTPTSAPKSILARIGSPFFNLFSLILKAFGR